MNAHLSCRICLKFRNVILAAILLFIVSGSPVFAQTVGFLVDADSKNWILLENARGDRMLPRSINDDGQVAGDLYTAGVIHAFITGPDGADVTELGTLSGNYSFARGINDAGQVVGAYSATGGGFDDRAFITGPNGVGMSDLGTLGGRQSSANDINNAGLVVGVSRTSVSGGAHRPFITGPNGVGMTELDVDRAFGSYEGHATGINTAGQVVGMFSDSSLRIGGAFITGPNGIGMTAVDEGALYRILNARDINNTGQVVGEAMTSSSTSHAFITGPDGVGITSLGALDGSEGSGIQSYATGINDAGQVVGMSKMDGHDRAFITDADGENMTDLNSLIDLPTGYLLTEATGINNNGQVIAVGVVPEPESYALMLAGLGLLGFVTQLRRSRKPKIHHAAFDAHLIGIAAVSGLTRG